VSSSPSPAPDLTVRPGVVSRAISGFGTSIGVGAALGGAAWISDQLSWPYSLLIPANAIGAWLGIAFILGASARTIPTGVLRGLIGLLSAVAAYYLLNAVLGQGFRVIGASHAATVWGVVALLAGPLMGGAGSVWRYGHGWPRAIGVGILAAALIAEGLVFGAGRFIHVDQLSTDPGALLLAVEILLGLALPLLLLRRGERLRGYVATAVLAVIAVAAIGPVTALVRALADRF
jgi:energy-converting hydrogenase Eha subunit A